MSLMWPGLGQSEPDAEHTIPLSGLHYTDWLTPAEWAIHPANPATWRGPSIDALGRRVVVLEHGAQ